MKNIPKKIHLIWFGEEEPNVPYLHKIRETYSNYQIKLWREVDFDIENACPFVKRAYSEKKWQFLADYYKMYVLNKEGGIYLEADMEPLKKLDVNSSATLILGYEHNNSITKGIIASSKAHRYTAAVMHYYESIVKPSYFFNSQVVLTEVLYDMYSGLNTKDETTMNRDLHLFDSSSFGLWKEKKGVDSYFIHRRDLNYSHSASNRFFKKAGSKFNSLIPSSLQNKRCKALVKNMEKEMRNELTNRPPHNITEIDDVGYLKKDLFDKIISHNGRVVVHLHYANEPLKKMLLRIFNVVSVTFGPEKTKFDYSEHIVEIVKMDDVATRSHDVVFKYAVPKGRTNIESKTNLYSRLLNKGIDGILDIGK